MEKDSMQLIYGTAFAGNCLLCLETVREKQNSYILSCETHKNQADWRFNANIHDNYQKKAAIALI